MKRYPLRHSRYLTAFCLLVVAFSLTVWGGDLEAKVTLESTSLEEIIVLGGEDSRIRAVMDVQERHTDDLMAEPGVVGTATGLTDAGNPAILVFAESFHAAQAAIIPARIEGVPVVVRITGKIRPLGNGLPIGTQRADPTSRFRRPVPIGVSTGHPNITAGTIGCRVTDGSGVYALSNNHIYADENRASIGDNVLQPGPVDGGIDPDDAIGTLSDFEPIVFSTFANNVIDAAIALSSPTLLKNSTPFGGYGTPKSEPIAASVGLRVMKYGRTTSKTRGWVDAINAVVNVQYGSGVARFVDQIVIRPGFFSSGGDSGSLIVVLRGVNARRPVGLLFAGSLEVTIANPIDAVLERFGVTIDGD
ncbi:MAG: hypothetical protein GTN74_00570 [Proteobacteria bacterium]|nr:hypothetical protein [Pseudomonadota bacterium]NIS67507.1 hypothetical protein [Pseudomonadota bacterium]